MARLLRSLWPVLILIGLPVVLFWEAIFTPRVLLPFDNLYAFPPWETFRESLGVAPPQNALLSDLVLENYVWKRFIREALSQGQLPLWNPYLFTGIPFLAAGQHSGLYPLSLLFNVLPLAKAFGYFTVLQFALAGFFVFLYLRVLGLGRWAALAGGVTYMLSGFMVVDVVFPMITAAASWLPFLLAMIELTLRDQRRRLLWLVLAGVGVALQFTAGHMEISYYVLLTAGLYAAFRLLSVTQPWRERLLVGSGLLAAVATGTLLAAVQLVPLYEVASVNFRQDPAYAATYEQVIGWAYPAKQLLTFVLPDFYGNPAHHRVLDLFQRRWVPTADESTFWGWAVGTKNYVEAGSYAGILPLFLAALAVWRRRDGYAVFFAALAALALALSFGLPIYRLPYVLLPGYEQLHTPFRWVFPYTLAVAVLAGMGAQELLLRPPARGWTLLTLGGALVVLLLSPVAATTVAGRLPQMVVTLGSASAAASYQMRNLSLLALNLTGAGLVFWLARRRRHWVGPLATAVVALDLLVAGWGFNPTSRPELAGFEPPSMRFLREQPGPFRITTYAPDGRKVLNANAGMYFGLQDVRGYDSIIPRAYANFMDLLEPTQGSLLYNRIEGVSSLERLRSPLLDLLNVGYVVASAPIPLPEFELVYQGEVLIYRNTEALPRTWMAPRAEGVAGLEQFADELEGADLRQTVFIEGEAPPLAGGGGRAGIARYTPNEVEVSTSGGGGWLVLADAYFPGWQVQVDGQPERLYKANGNFRAAWVPPGEHRVVFRYSPMSFKVGLLASFVGAMALLLALAAWLWRQLYVEEAGQTAKRLAKNSFVPLGTNLLNRGMDFALAMLMLRVLGPEGAGKYAFAVVIIGFVEIFSNFGLNLLLTREVSRRPEEGGRYLIGTTLLRLVLLLAALPLLGLFILAWQRWFGLATDTIAAILLLALALAPGSVAAALSSLFYAYEKMEYPAFITTVSTLLKVFLGAGALLLGYGFVGLAGVSVVVNLAAALLLATLAWRVQRPSGLAVAPGLMWGMIGLAYPLMLNHLLQTVFFKIDITLLQALQGATVVGWYSTAYKWVEPLPMITGFVTLALFPLMSRYAASDRGELKRIFTLALRSLLLLAAPLTVLTALLAEPLILILGGREFLPHGAIALRVMIWFLPLSFINGVTQYLLIGLNRQKAITGAFLLAAGFNLAANLVFIPRYSYVAAAVITILSEVVLFLPFYRHVRAELGSLDWPAIVRQPLGAGLIMLALAVLLRPAGLLPATLGAAAGYLAGLYLLGALRGLTRERVRQLLPWARTTS